MNYIIFCSIVIIVVILGVIISYWKIKKHIRHLEQLKRIADEDFYTMECQSIAEEKAVSKIKDNIASSIYELNRILKDTTSKISKYELQEQIKRLEEECNNLDVIISLEPENNNTTVDIEKEIKDLIDELPFNDNRVNINVQKGIETKFIFDNKKLMSALKIIILKSLENGENDKITININCTEKINSKSKIVISINNVHLTDKDSEISKDDISAFFNMKTIDPDYCAYIEKINDPDLFIIRQNILYLSGKIFFCHENNAIINKKTTNLNIALFLEREKQKRKYFKALIVDDSEAIAKMNQEVLQNIKVDSDIVLSGAECIKAINENYDDYDIIFTDNQMPEMNGTELLKELKKDDSFNLPVVIVTSDNGMKHYFKEQCGFNDYVVKPLNEKIAKKIIKEQLESND